MGITMQYPHINPVLFRLGPLELRWYGLMYVISFIVAYFLLRSNAKRKNLPLTMDDIADLIFCLALGVILGGRIGYILFYNLSYYLENPLKVFAIWEGGMSFHGGLIGTVLSAIYFARKKKVTFFQLADLCVPVAPIGLFLGRLGNFINGELYGRVTHVPWGMVFPGGGNVPRHPSELYEAFLEGPVLFTILWLVQRKKNLPVGVVFWCFVMFYGAFRFLVEFTREPDPQLGFVLGSFSMGQLLSLPMFLFGLCMIIVLYKRQGKKERAAQG
jgi:phosphatidylglycerol:prolipoprotein diacylglycerol transferase